MNYDLLDISAEISSQTGQPNKENTIAFCVDDNYLPYALFVAEQFIELHPDLPCDICICLTDISKVPENFMNSNIRFIELSVNGIESFPTDRITIAAYYRLFLPEIFRNTYKYIIYLDADVYINRSFYSDLMHYIEGIKQDFSVAAAADVLEINYSSHFKGRKIIGKEFDEYLSLYHRFNHIYRNSGVLVFNTKRYNENKILYKILEYSFKNHDKLKFHDQSALNSTLLSDIALLPFSFNWQLKSHIYKFKNEMNPHIIHFVGPGKPWIIDDMYTKPYKDLYIDFLTREFPTKAVNLMSYYQLRSQERVHRNFFKEFISREKFHLSVIKIEFKNKMSLYQKDKYNIKQVLSNPPFYLTNI